MFFSKSHPKSHKLRVAVLMGGPSREHEMSIRSGRNVMRALKDKYEVQGVLVSKSGEWPFSPEDLKQNADVAFIAMHGTYGEDGTVQYFLDEIGMPYTGSGALQSALAMNKLLSLRALQDHGFRVSPSFLINQGCWRRNPFTILNNINHYLHYPLVVKPNALGSSVGVEIVEAPVELDRTIERGFESARDLVAQSYIPGREFTCAVLDHGTKGTAYPLLPTEIIPRSGRFFDYKEKYSESGAIEVTPANINEIWTREIRRAALRAHEALGCRGMSRTDMILGRDGVLYILETNTIPGFASRSLLPQGAAAMGISFPGLLDRVIQAAFVSHHAR